jgi:ADP-L-glycero-D-manno-heptose 6-epimerase
MILLTGAAGFIGSCMLTGLNRQGETDIVLVDDFSRPDKKPNYEGKSYRELLNRDLLFEWLDRKAPDIRFVIHMGARTDTTEQDWEIFRILNLEYSQRIWIWCASHGVPLIYASSAATFGGGEHGFSDSHSIVDQLQPLNPYGRSKQLFDQWALAQSQAPPFWAGLKFFNVYGPNEYHKGRMASVVFHAFHQIRESGMLKLFRSHRPDYPDGGQMRDFIYVMDTVKVMLFLMRNRPASGLYNVGSGNAATFKTLAANLFHSLSIPENIVYIDTPEDIRDTYQYFTEAETAKIRAAGYQDSFQSLENGIADYVGIYLLKGKYH